MRGTTAAYLDCMNGVWYWWWITVKRMIKARLLDILADWRCITFLVLKTPFDHALLPDQQMQMRNESLKIPRNFTFDRIRLVAFCCWKTSHPLAMIDLTSGSVHLRDIFRLGHCAVSNHKSHLCITGITGHINSGFPRSPLTCELKRQYFNFNIAEIVNNYSS